MIPLFLYQAGACPKNHSGNLHASLCGIFHPNYITETNSGGYYFESECQIASEC